MAVFKMMQGDSYIVPFSITVNKTNHLTPDMISELEVCVGDDGGAKIRKTFSSGEVGYDDILNKWFFRPTQEETFSLEPGGYDVEARVKFGEDKNANVVGMKIGRITILDSQSEEIV